MTLEQAKAKLNTLPFFQQEGFDTSKIQVHFVDKLPYQFSGNFTAKVWGEYNVYIRKDKYENAAALFRSFVGIRLFCHECVHLLQIHKDGSFAKFGIKYLLSYVFPALLKYRRIPYEKEAYAEQEALAHQMIK